MNSENNGTYIAIKYDNLSSRKIINLCKSFGLPNIVPIDKLHTTIIYSTVHADNPLIDAESTYNSFIDKLDIFVSSSGIKCLVALLDSSKLIARNKELTDKYGFVSDYPEYIPHVTLSYDIEDWNKFDSMNTYIKNVKYLYMMQGYGEYAEELNLDWKDEL